MRRSSHSPAPRPAWWRALLVLVTGIALAFGSVSQHDMAAEQAGGFARSEIAVSAVHPGDPAHFEASDVQTHPPCLACLLQLQNGTVLGRPPGMLPPIVHGDNFAALCEQARAQEPSGCGPARAPPAFPPFA